MNKILDSIYLIVLPLIPDKQLLKWEFRWHMGYPINLNDPKTLNEKTNWLKLNDCTPLHILCEDKYDVIASIKEKI